MKLTGFALEEYVLATIEKELLYYFVSDHKAYKLHAHHTKLGDKVNEAHVQPTTLEEWQILCKLMDEKRIHVNSKWALDMDKEDTLLYQVLEAGALDGPESPPPVTPTALTDEEIQMLKAVTGHGPRIRHHPAGIRTKKGQALAYLNAKDAGEDVSPFLEPHEAYTSKEVMNGSAIFHDLEDYEPYTLVWFAGDIGVEVSAEKDEMVLIRQLIQKGLLILGPKQGYQHLTSQHVSPFWEMEE